MNTDALNQALKEIEYLKDCEDLLDQILYKLFSPLGLDINISQAERKRLDIEDLELRVRKHMEDYHGFDDSE